MFITSVELHCHYAFILQFPWLKV